MPANGITEIVRISLLAACCFTSNNLGLIINNIFRLNELWRIDAAKLINLVFIVLIFAFDFHVLWLMYDIVAIMLAFYFAFSRKASIGVLPIGVLGIVLGYFVVMIFAGEYVLFGLLSLWDTLKHLIYIALFVRWSRNRPLPRISDQVSGLSHLIFIAFAIQLILVFWQYRQGYFFDDISGTFGNGGSHAIAYISVLVVVAMLVRSFNIVIFSCVIALTIFMNLVSENAGYYVLLGLVLGGVFLGNVFISRVPLMRGISLKNLLSLFIILAASYWVLGIAMYSDLPYWEVTLYRLIDISGVGSTADSNAIGRGVSLLKAIDVGGWFGHGLGAYSNIYEMIGYDFKSMSDTQINISELTHLVAEAGGVGYFLYVFVYSLFISQLFLTRYFKLFASVLFVACSAYSAVLMNESQFFLLLLTLFFISMLERRGLFNGGGTVRLDRSLSDSFVQPPS